MYTGLHLQVAKEYAATDQCHGGLAFDDWVQCVGAADVGVMCVMCVSVIDRGDMGREGFVVSVVGGVDGEKYQTWGAGEDDIAGGLHRMRACGTHPQ